MKSAFARGALLAMIGLAGVEWAMAGWAYRTRVDPEDWERARQAMAALPEGEPVVLATPWLGPRARMQLRAARGFDSAARPDLRGLARFHVLGLGGARWSAELEDDLEDMAPPELDATHDLGALRLTTYVVRSPETEVASLVDLAGEVRVETERRCKGGPRVWQCREGRVELRVAEIDYRPRRCFAVDMDDGTLTRLTIPSMTTGSVLRGHVGFDDFNSRIRSDAPVELAERVDGAIAARFTVTDEQGWWPFALGTEPGPHAVSIELRHSLRGIWKPRGYSPRSAHAACVELRAMREEAS